MSDIASLRQALMQVATGREKLEFMKQIIELRNQAKPLLAPNGKPSNLNVMQHAQVRTPEFKAWFGDFEVAARQNHWRGLVEKALTDNQWQSRTLLAQDNDADPSGKLSETFGFKVTKQYLTPDDLRKTNKKHGEGNEKFKDQLGLTHDDYVKALEVLRDPQTYRITKSRNGKPSAEFGREFSDGTIVVAEVETAEDGAVSVKSVWKKVSGRIHVGASTYPNRKTSEAAAIDNSIHSDNLLVNADSVSKIVDENGEPRIVYHGTDADFLEFSAKKSRDSADLREGDGFYFTEKTKQAEDFGGVLMPVFLNINNPFEHEPAQMSYLKTKGIRTDSHTNLSGNLRKKTHFDGLINGDTYIAFHSNQIKSAIGNKGTFSADKNSILDNLNTQIEGKMLADTLKNYDYATPVKPVFDRAEPYDINDIGMLRTELMAAPTGREKLDFMKQILALRSAKSVLEQNPDLETFTAEDLIPDGDDNTVKTAKGTKVSTGFAVIEANKLIVSHDNQGNENPEYPYELEPRDRKRAESVAWVLKTAKNLDVDSLGKTRRADSGAPIITDLLAQSPITQEQAETWVNAQIIDKSSLKPLQNQGYAKEDVRKDMVEFYRISGGNLRPSCSF